MALHWAFNPLGIGGYGAYPGERGVFISSGGDLKYSAMVVSNGTIGLGQLGDYMKVYSRGSALNYTVSSGAVQVFPGGLVSGFTHLGGSTYVYNSGLITGTLINVPMGVANNGFFVSNGGSAVTTTIIRGGITATGSAVILSTTLLSGYLFVSSGSYASAVVVGGYQNPGGYIAIRDGGIAEDIVLSSGGSALVYTDAIGSNITVSSAGYLVVRVGSGLVSSATVLSGGTITMSGGSADTVDFDGGRGTVSSGGRLTNIQASNGAPITVTGSGAYLSGGTVHGRPDSTADVETASTRIAVQSGGVVEDLVLDYLVASNTNWAKPVLLVYNDGIASNIHAMGSSYYGGSIYVSNGGSAIDCEMNRYGFYIYTGGTAVRPVVSQATGNAQLYAYGGATVYDLRNLRGVTSAHHNSYISGGVVSGGSLLEWGSATSLTVSAYKSGTANVRGTLQVNHGTTVSASSAHIGTATDTINKGGIVTIQGGTMHTLMMQPDLEATNLGATATVRNHANNAVVAEDRVGYLTGATVSGAPTAGGVRSWLYISSGGVASGATMHASGCIVVSSGGRIEDLHISNNDAGYAFSMTSGASAHNVYRVGSHGSNGTGMAVALIDRGAEVTNLHNSGGGAPYTILNRGHISGYYAYTVLNGGTVERTYLYNQHLSGYLEDVHLYGLGSSGSAENLLYIASSSYAQNIYAESGFNTVWVIQSAFAQNLYASGGALVIDTSSGCSAAHMSGAIAGVMNGVASDVVIDQPFPPGAPSRSFYVNPTGSADGITRYTPNDVASTWSIVYFPGGTATNVATYGGNGGNINLLIYSSGHVSGLTMANYNGGSPYSEVRGGFVYDFTQSGGWFYVRTSGTASTALIQNGYVTGMSEGLQKNGVIRVSSGAVASNISALALANTDYYGVVYVLSAGITKDTYQIGGYWDVSAGGAASDHVLSGGGRVSATGINARPAYFRVSSGGVAYNVSAIATGRDSDNQVNRCWMYVYSGGYISGAYISGYGSALANKGGTITDLIDLSQADIYGSLGYATNYGYINLGAGGVTGAYADNITQYGGRTRVYGANNGDATLEEIQLYGGTLWVWTGGTVSSALIDRGTSATAVMQVSGGMAYNVTVNGGELQLLNPSLVSGITAANSGIVHVSSGGVASTATVSSGGIMNISSAGIASSVIVLSGGTLYVSAGGEVDGGTFYSGGALTVNSGTLRNYIASGWINIWGSSYVISCTTTPSGTIAVNNATHVSDCVLSGGAIWIQNGATASNTTVSSGRFMVSSGCVASDTVVLSGGSVYVSSGSVVYDTTVNDGGIIYVYSYGEASNTIVNSGGRFTVSSGGLLVGTVASNAANCAISYYGSAMDLQMINPQIWIYSGTVVTDLSLASGGSCTVSAGEIGAVSVDNTVLLCCLAGSGADVILTNGAIAKIYTGYQLTNVTVGSACTFHISSASIATSTTVNSLGSAIVSANGSALETTVTKGGLLSIMSAGYASGGIVSNASAMAWLAASDAVGQVRGIMEGATIVGPGARVNLYPTGVVASCTATSDGYLLTSQGGVVSSCYFDHGHLVAISGGSGVACSAVNQGSLQIRELAYMRDCTVAAGGYAYVRSGSVASNTTINSGGSAIVSTGGSAISAVVNSSGLMWVYGTATGTIINSGGRVNTMSGGTTLSAFYASSGYGYISSGGKESSSIVSGGQLNVFGTAYEPVCEALSGRIYVSSGGTLSGGTITTSAQIHIRETGVAYNVTVMPTGILKLLADGQVNTVNVSGGAVEVSSGGILNDITIVSNGLLTANDGAEVYGIVASDAEDLTKTSIQLSPLAMAYGTIIVNHARAHLAGTIETLSALDSAIVVASSGCNMMSAYIEGYDTELHVQGGAVVDTLGMEQGQAYISSGGVISATDAQQVIGTATISSGGLLHIGEFAYFEYFVCLSGGTVYVDPSAEYDDYESEPGAVIIWGD